MLYTHILKKSISGRYPLKVIANGIYAVHSGPTAPTPFKLKFENTTICNLRCVMCPLSVGLKRPTGSLSYDNFKFVFDQIYPCYLNLTGIGEPLLNRDIFKIINYAKDKRTFVKLDSNATLMTREKGIQMLEAGPDILSISMDGATKETYEKIRVPAKWEKFIAGTETILGLKKELGKKNTEMHSFMVVQRENFNELPEYIQMASDMGFDSINGTFVIRLGNNENENTGLDNITSMQARDVYERTKKVLKNVKVPVRIDNLLEFLKNFDVETGVSANKGHNIDKSCFLPWYTPYITWDGNVCPCDFYAENEIVFGNVFEEPFMKIWNNEKARAFRKQLITKRVGICATCGVNEDDIYNKFRFATKVPILNQITHRRG